MNRRFLLTGSALAAASAVLVGCTQPDPRPDIVDLATSTDSLSTLATAVQTAGLTDTLRGPGPFTVFAPTNAAFDALPAGTVDTLLTPENRDQLTDILTYHVVPGTITSDQLAGEVVTVTTVQGQELTVDGRMDKYGSGVTVNGETVVQADIMASNGVVHVIDGVLMPE